MPFLPPNQQRQSTEGTKINVKSKLTAVHNREKREKTIQKSKKGTYNERLFMKLGNWN